MNVVFTQTAWKQYIQWQVEDKKIVKRINQLIKDIERHGVLQGIGKPEIMKYEEAYSRRIDKENRLVYNIEKTNLVIYSCRYHYKK